jgi:hypothetical protein
MSQESGRDSAFEKRSREVLEESTGRLDGRTLSRLTQARHAALAQGTKAARPWWLVYLPAGAATAAAVLAVVLWNGSGMDPGSQLAQGGRSNGNGASAFEDIDLLADAPEFFSDADELEFYEWAAGEIES